MLASNDLLCVKSIDRLGRDYEEIQSQWRYLIQLQSILTPLTSIYLLIRGFNSFILCTLSPGIALECADVSLNPTLASLDALILLVFVS